MKTNKLIMGVLIVLLALLTLQLEGHRVQRQTSKVLIFRKLICKRSNPRCLSIDICRYVALNSTSGNLTLGVTIHQKVEKLIVHMKEWKKTGKVFAPTMMDLTFNLCDLTKNFNGTSGQVIQNIVKNVNPFFFDTFWRLFHLCPYEGKMFFTALLTQKTLDGASSFVSATGEYKFEVEFFNEENLCFSTLSYKTIK